MENLVLRESIRQMASAEGFQDVRFCEPDVSDYVARHQACLNAGFHGSMAWLEQNTELRYFPARLVEGVRTIMLVRMDYRPDSQDAMETVLNKPGSAYIARYALGRDYHKLVRRRLTRLGQKINDRLAETGFRAFVDSAPVLERQLAEKSGMGWMGRNTLLLNKKAGSWFFLGELFLTLDLPPDAGEAGAHCGSCRSCVDICPTDALKGDGSMDARRCISYLTIEHDGPIAEEFRPALGNRIYGCDDCQLGCPFNRFSSLTAEPDFLPRTSLDSPELIHLWKWTEAEFLKYLEGSPIRRIGYERWQRNLAVAIGNSRRADWIPELLNRLEAASPMVGEHVLWAVEQLRKTEGIILKE